MNEIEEFLRRAAALREQQAQQRAGRPTPAARPSSPPAGTYRPPVLDAEVIEEAEEVTGDDVAEYVRRHLDPQSFHDRSQRAAGGIRSADDVMEAHLQQTFEHRLGNLGAVTSRPEDSTLDAEENAAKAKPASVPEILRLLSSPQALRNAIVLGELLTPPSHRW